MEKQLNLRRINLINLVKEELCSSAQAAASLDVSQRQIQRLTKLLKENNNPSALLPRPRSYWNKKPVEICNLAVSLKKESSQRSNYAIADLIKENTGQEISPVTVRKILLDNHCYQKEDVKRRTFKMFEAKCFGCSAGQPSSLSGFL